MADPAIREASNDPEIQAALHYSLHPDHVVEVIYRFTRTTGNPYGELTEPAYLKRWVCHNEMQPGNGVAVADLARRDVVERNRRQQRALENHGPH